MNINEFKQSVLTKWSQHSTEGLEGGVARRRTPLVYQLVDEICRQVNKDFEQHQSEERRSGLLETFDLWVGWTNLAVEDWTFLHMKVRHEGLAQAVIWMSGQLDEARTHTPITDPALPSESDLEDAYHALDAIAFTGSPKQINWARSIALNGRDALAMLWKQGVDVKLPTQAAWWIENRGNLFVALRDIS
ncbi:hypothetical protein NEA10_20755 (plasmid) [Phormidium yuhuli AB48]|jgi:hypothetical protein|uniref:Uncharacterized protein n=1 Tax=Phormidium yuhuli AB48 TaxID=2940671 RepID=A0ABY5AWV3_9CYAN|nr:hypothetical protein [Phormidium yuhuli]USR93277.1 hypothetical protein NEA10_20755 [Phormidium yuhuli AB48]